MSKLHSMLAEIRDRVHGSSIVQGFDKDAAVTVGFMAGEWQALMHELDAVMGKPEQAPQPQQVQTLVQAPAPAPTAAPAPAPAPAPAEPLAQVAEALASNPSPAPASAGPTEAPLV